METGEIRQNVISSSHFCPTFFDFCNPCFFYHTITNDVDFVDKAYAEICDHSLFTFNCRYYNTVVAYHYTALNG